MEIKKTTVDFHIKIDNAGALRVNESSPDYELFQRILDHYAALDDSDLEAAVSTFERDWQLIQEKYKGTSGEGYTEPVMKAVKALLEAELMRREILCTLESDRGLECKCVTNF